jgi:phage terminase large subunit GpA-like protein
VTARNEVMRGVMDAISDPSCETVVVMSSVQVGKTETINNIVGYHMDNDPCPMLLIQPTLEMAETWSKDRLAPMLRDTPALHGKIDLKARDSGNSLLYKRFPSGYIAMAGANSPASLASRPVRLVLCDEVDRYPLSAGEEGDPVSLARKRTTTFWNRKIVLVSTPTIKGVSRIELEFELSDKRHYYVKCPHCDHEQRLVWGQVQWPEGKPREAYYVCEDSGCVLTDAQRWDSLRKGRWLASEPFNRVAGFHLSELYSPWVALGDMAQNFINAKRSPETLKTWVNTSLGESWLDDGVGADASGLMDRLEDWGPYAPDKVLVVTCGIDTQNDRFEIERVGWGLDEESYSLEHKVLYVDPSSPEAWRELDEYLRTPTITADGRSLPVAATCIDSGGHHTNAVYNFVRDKVRRKVWAIKGMANSGGGRPIFPKRASKNNSGKINLYLVGVDTAKDAIYARMKMEKPGPGYMHFPKGREKAYFDSISSERVITKYVRGYPQRQWVKTSSARNEALDCRVYAMAALYSLSVSWTRLLKERDSAPRVEIEVPEMTDDDSTDVETTVSIPVPAPMDAPRIPRFRRGISYSKTLNR